MGTNHFYSELSIHGIKVYKFQQRKFSNVDRLGAGVCLPLTLLWIKEKLTEDRASTRLGFHKSRFKPKEQQQEHTQNESTIEKALALDLRVGSENRHGRIAEVLRIKQVDCYVDHQSFRNLDLLPQPSLLLSMIELSNKLKINHAAAVSFSVGGAGASRHIVAFYRGKAEELDFFCPNVGAYRILRPLDFCRSYIDGSENRPGWGKLTIPLGHSQAWCTIYSKSGWGI
jgi:hypothetical protein